jgi:plastocyanin
MTRLLALTVLLLTAALPFAWTATASTPKLVGTVGPGFTITVTKVGKKVKTLPAGTYTLTVNDKASIHNFEMDGPKGYEKEFTKVPFKGSKTYTVKLVKGTYKYYCAAHESSMFGTFTVS